jgi:hypothetical protein
VGPSGQVQGFQRFEEKWPERTCFNLNSLFSTLLYVYYLQNTRFTRRQGILEKIARVHLAFAMRLLSDATLINPCVYCSRREAQQTINKSRINKLFNCAYLNSPTGSSRNVHYCTRPRAASNSI